MLKLTYLLTYFAIGYLLKPYITIHITNVMNEFVTFAALSYHIVAAMWLFYVCKPYLSHSDCLPQLPPFLCHATSILL